MLWCSSNKSKRIVQISVKLQGPLLRHLFGKDLYIHIIWISVNTKLILFDQIQSLLANSMKKIEKCIKVVTLDK